MHIDDLTFSDLFVTDGNTVNVLSIEYQRMSEKWELLHALLGGTASMRLAGEKWLPREPREDLSLYENRLERSFLFSAYEDTVEKLVAKPFSRPVTIQGDLPEQIQPMVDDVDRTGCNITQFLMDGFRKTVIYGLHHFFIDFPTMPEGASLAFERQVGARPVFVHVPAPCLIGWQTERTLGGKIRLIQVRIYEVRIESDGEFGEVENHYIRVFNAPVMGPDGETIPGTWELWRFKRVKDKEDRKKGEWERIAGPTIHSFPEVPLVTVYAERTGVLTANPPLDTLAWLNLAHWQSESDQRNILRFARVGLMFGAGFSDEDVENGIVVGPNKLITTSNPDAKLTYVEHNGKAIGAGSDDLETLERRMEVLGLQPLLQQTRITATKSVLDESRTQSSMQSWVKNEENAALEAFKFAAMWLGTELPEDISVDIFNDFEVGLMGTSEIAELTKARQSGELSLFTYLREQKRRGFLSDSLVVEEEIARIESEGPGLAFMSMEDEESDDDTGGDTGKPVDDTGGAEPTEEGTSPGQAKPKRGTRTRTRTRTGQT